MATIAVLGYWNIRGLAQPIRFLLEYTNTKYSDKLYSCGPAPNYDKSCWFDKKFNLGLDFPNLPYYIDGNGMKICQSDAILRHIGRINGMCGKTEEEKVRVDMMAAQTTDTKMNFIVLCYNENFETLRSDYLKNLESVFQQYSDFLGDRPWFAGDTLTYPDFVMYEVLDQHLLLSSTCLDNFPHLHDFHKRFEELPAIQAYMNSPRFIKAPINNKMATFGNV